MKKLFTFLAVVGASLVVINGNAQEYDAAPPPPAPPVYQDQDVYPAAPGVVCEADFPGYAYYDYPAWNGHYRDYYYYAHYRPFFERRYAGYFAGGRFDYGRFRGAYGGRGWAPAVYGGRGFAGGGYVNRGYSD